MYIDDEKVISLVKEINVGFINIFKLSTSTGFKKNSKCDVVLSERQFHILYAINKRNINTTSTLAEFFDLSKANISIIVSKLEASGHIIKAQGKDNKDGRNVFFQITPKGKEDLELQKKDVEHNMEVCFLSLIPNDEKLKLMDIAVKLSGLVRIEFDYSDAFESVIILMMVLKRYIDKSLEKALATVNIDISLNDFMLLQMMGGIYNSIDGISVATGISNSAISTQVNSLLDRGYIYKEIDKKDKRKKYFYVYDDKKRIIEEIIENQAKTVATDVRNATEEEQATILEILTNFKDILNKSVESLKSMSK